MASDSPRTARIAALNVYPVKSCRGIPLERARIAANGFERDREWLIVRRDGRFMTQREEPRLALIEPALTSEGLQLRAPGVGALLVPYDAVAAEMEVVVWQDKCAAFDAGDDAAAWLQAFLGKAVRLVRFDPRRPRPSDPAWTGGAEALNYFTDAFPWLVLSQGSLDDLNARLPTPLPMNRFRPNIVIDGVAPYAEDHAREIAVDGVRFAPVKPCTRCAITTTDQSRGERDGEEPLRTLRQYRFNRELKGVAFGQNLILIEGLGREIRVGQQAALISA